MLGTFIVVTDAKKNWNIFFLRKSRQTEGEEEKEKMMKNVEEMK